MPLGAPKLISVDGAEEITKELKAYYAPGALDAAFKGVVAFIRYRGTAESIDNCPAQFDQLRKVAESRLGGGRIRPEVFNAILYMAGASPTHNHQVLVLASTHGQLDM